MSSLFDIFARLSKRSLFLDGSGERFYIVRHDVGNIGERSWEQVRRIKDRGVAVNTHALHGSGMTVKWEHCQAGKQLLLSRVREKRTPW